MVPPIVTDTVAVPNSPVESVTVTVAFFTPLVEYVHWMGSDVPVRPSVPVHE
jgi:hypothetical protein